MTNTLKLKCEMLVSGFTIKTMAESMGLSYYGFYRKLTNKSFFKATEITRACELLGIDDVKKNEIFFASPVAKMETEKTTIIFA